MRLGWQTTGDGLVYRGAIGDTATLDPSGINNAWMLLDTANGNLYAYRAKAWRLVSGGGGGGGLTMPFDGVTFNVNETDASERELQYSEEKGYLQYGGLDSVQIPLLPGIWYVRNDTSVTIPKGTVVRATGTLGASGRIKVKHMIANGTIDAMYILGIAMQDIAVGADGYVMTQGKIRNVNTQAYSEGAVLYADVDTLGGLTQTEPTGSNLKLPIAFVVHSASNGTLAVRVSPGTYLRDLHDAYITSPDSSASLYYNTSESVWRDTTPAALKSDISGTANRLAMFTGANTVGNSIVTQNGRSMYINSTQDNSAFSLSNSFQFNGFGSNNTDQPSIGVFGNTGTNPGHRPYLAMYRSFGDTANSKTLVPYNSYLGSIVWHGADGVNLASRGAEIGAITDSITGVTDMPTALFFGTTTNGAASPTERMRITSPGNVGINTTTPAYRLDVNGDVNTTGMYKKSGTDIISGTTNYIPKFTGSNTVGNSQIFDNGTNVGLANTSPISGNGGGLTIGSPSAGRGLHLYSSGSGLFMYPTGSSNPSLQMGSSDADSSILYYTYFNYSHKFFTTNVERFRISHTGNVGIGTASPGYKLSVAKYTSGTTQGEIVQSIIGNTVYSTVGQWAGLSLGTYADKVGIFAYDGYNNFGRNDLVFAVASGGNINPVTLTDEKMRILNNGNVGIATSSPSRPLHVAGTTAIRIPVGTTSDRGTSANGDIRYNTTNANFEWYSGTGWREPVNAARSPNTVGIANSFSKFDASGLLDTSAILIQANNRIGIFNSPAAGDSALTVTGGIRATRDMYARRYNVSTFTGQVLSINNYAPAGSLGRNVWIGDGGQSSSYILGANGSFNISLGGGALLKNTTGAYNSALGSRVLENNTTGISNIGIGALALLNNVSGEDNIAIGASSLQDNLADKNIAIGGAALRLNTTGTWNFAFGLQAAYSNTTGNFNMAYGAFSMYFNQTGSQNIAIGYNALRGGSTLYSANSNISIGHESMYSHNTGNNNVSIGTFAGRYNTSGVALDSTANSVFIGYDTRAAGDNQTNQVVIGYQAIGNGSNTTTIGNSSTTATILQYGETRLGMAVDSGAYTLQVSGNTKLMGNVARKKPVTIAAGTYTVLSDDSWLICNHTAPITITLPTAANSIGRELMIKYVAGGGATVISNAINVSPIVGGALTNIILPATAGSWVTLVCDGANWIIMQKG